MPATFHLLTNPRLAPRVDATEQDVPLPGHQEEGKLGLITLGRLPVVTRTGNEGPVTLFRDVDGEIGEARSGGLSRRPTG